MKEKRRSKHFKNIGIVADMYSFRNNAIFRKWTCSIVQWASSDGQVVSRNIFCLHKGYWCLAGKCDENMINDNDDLRLKPGVSEEKEKCVAS